MTRYNSCTYDPAFCNTWPIWWLNERLAEGLTVNGGGQQGGHDLPLALLVPVEEALEAVEHGAAQHKRLPLVHHRHQQHHDGGPGGSRRETGHNLPVVLIRLVIGWFHMIVSHDQNWYVFAKTQKLSLFSWLTKVRVNCLINQSTFKCAIQSRWTCNHNVYVEHPSWRAQGHKKYDK